MDAPASKRAKVAHDGSSESTTAALLARVAALEAQVARQLPRDTAACVKQPFSFNVLSYPSTDHLAAQLRSVNPERFHTVPIKWEKFSDSGMDHIVVGGFYDDEGKPKNIIRRSHILFLADFFSNDAILSQLHVLEMLCESFIKTLTIVLPYLPTATMERTVLEGEVATANTISRMISQLPMIGPPARVMFYDLHTLQNRFYLHTGAIATLHSAVPLLKEQVLEVEGSAITAIAFPDEGAQKRFGKMFGKLPQITCGKKRIGEERKVVIQDGDPKGEHVLIIDDMVKTGGTLASCATVLMEHGATAMSAFCTHAAFPEGGAKRFCKGGDRAVFEHFYVSTSNPVCVASLPMDDGVFVVLDLLPQIIKDL